jgi:hypothetical protein
MAVSAARLDPELTFASRGFEKRGLERFRGICLYFYLRVYPGFGVSFPDYPRAVSFNRRVDATGRVEIRFELHR